MPDEARAADELPTMPTGHGPHSSHRTPSIDAWGNPVGVAEVEAQEARYRAGILEPHGDVDLASVQRGYEALWRGGAPLPATAVQLADGCLLVLAADTMLESAQFDQLSQAFSRLSEQVSTALGYRVFGLVLDGGLHLRVLGPDASIATLDDLVEALATRLAAKLAPAA